MAPRSYGRAAYGGNTVPRGGASGISIPGYDAAYYYNLTNRAAQAAYGAAAYGGRQSIVWPAAGMFAVPDPEAGFISLPAWWAFARSINVTRIDADGNRTPVRGSSPAVLTGLSRRNSASNPKARDGLTGYSAGTNTTLSRLTAEATPSEYVTTAIRATATAAGSVSVLLAIDAVSPSGSAHGFWFRTATLASAVSLTVSWYDAASALIGTTTHPVSDVARSEAVGAWSRAEVYVESPYTNAATGVGSLVATGLSAGGTFDFTGRLTEQDDTLRGGYFDGDYPGAAWLGTPGLSFSDVAPINTLVDGEAPMDVPVHYELTNPLAPGIVITTNPVTLDSRGRYSWLTHPANPLQPVRVEILGPFGPLTRAIEQGVYYPLDSADGLPIVRTQSARRGKTGTIRFLATSHDERDNYLKMFQDGSPVLIRPPKTYGEGSAMWLSLGELTEDQAAYYSESKFRTLSAPFYQVASPLVANNEVAA